MIGSMIKTGVYKFPFGVNEAKPFLCGKNEKRTVLSGNNRYSIFFGMLNFMTPYSGVIRSDGRDGPNE